jgi:hypothetical protein
MTLLTLESSNFLLCETARYATGIRRIRTNLPLQIELTSDYFNRKMNYMTAGQTTMYSTGIEVKHDNR